MRLRLLLACLCATAAVPVALAEAKAPPTGKYDCTIGGSTLFGTLAIKAGGVYTHSGTKGKFVATGGRVTFPDGIKGWRISFKGGSLNRVKGRWYRTKDARYEIALRNPRDNFESIYCDRRK